MMWFIIFILTLLGIVALFVLKHVERARGVQLFCVEKRAQLSDTLSAFEERFEWRSVLTSVHRTTASVRFTITHYFARITAKIAKWIEWRARSIAHKSAQAKQDVVNTQTEAAQARENGYLKQVTELKDSLDTTQAAERAKDALPSA